MGGKMPASGKGDEMSDAELQQRSEANLRHGAFSYKNSGRLPARLEAGFDRKLAEALLEHAGGDPAFELLAQSTARRATMVEIVFSWLAREDVKVLWTEEKNGQKVVRWQPVLDKVGSWMEGLRRDLDALGLTPASAAKLGLPSERGAIDYETLIAKQRESENGEE